MVVWNDNLYSVETEYTQKRILIKLENGERACVTHKSITITFEHHKTHDKLVFRITGRDKWYAVMVYRGIPKELETNESEMRAEFARLLDKRKESVNANAVMTKVKFLLAMGI